MSTAFPPLADRLAVALREGEHLRARQSAGETITADEEMKQRAMYLSCISEAHADGVGWTGPEELEWAHHRAREALNT